MLNKAQVIGNLGQDPKVVGLGGGRGTVTSFTVATTEKGYKTARGTEVPEKTEWHNVVCFGRLAEVAGQYLRKGSRVFIEGKMRTRGYTDKNGVKRTITEINAEMMEMLDGKPQAQTNEQKPLDERHTPHYGSAQQQYTPRQQQAMGTLNEQFGAVPVQRPTDGFDVNNLPF